MSSKYKMYLKQSGTFKFPVLPEQISVTYGSSNTKVMIYGVGEVTILQDSAAANIEFKSYFPKHYFIGCNYKDIPDPVTAKETILKMMKSKKAIRFTMTGGLGVSMYVSIESFDCWEDGGDVGTIYFKIKMKEYREVTMRQLDTRKSVSDNSGVVLLSRSLPRVDAEETPSTYTVKPGDCLYTIAKSLYGTPDWNKIYLANKPIIGGNPNKILVGQVLSIPSLSR